MGAWYALSLGELLGSPSYLRLSPFRMLEAQGSHFVWNVYLDL